CNFCSILMFLVTYFSKQYSFFLFYRGNNVQDRQVHEGGRGSPRLVQQQCLRQGTGHLLPECPHHCCCPHLPLHRHQPHGPERALDHSRRGRPRFHLRTRLRLQELQARPQAQDRDEARRGRDPRDQQEVRRQEDLPQGEGGAHPLPSQRGCRGGVHLSLRLHHQLSLRRRSLRPLLCHPRQPRPHLQRLDRHGRSRRCRRFPLYRQEL
ncbi:hypothetical protein PFISCL1PPCAC_16179, partial [Pristionchus fissidentatus]